MRKIVRFAAVLSVAMAYIALPSAAYGLPRDLVESVAHDVGLPMGGFTSPNVEWIKNIASPGFAETGILVEGYYYVNVNQRGLLIYDVTDPLNPVEVGYQPLPHVFENESVATNGEIALMSSGGDVRYGGIQGGLLFVIDVTDKSSPFIRSVLPGAGDHTYECLLDCTWAYGGLGNIVDLRNPDEPILLEEQWKRDLQFIENGGAGHDVSEVRPGYVLTATRPMYFLDATDPVHPKPLAWSDGSWGSLHNVLWPNAGKDHLIISADEFGAPGNGSCAIGRVIDSVLNGDPSLKTWNANGWQGTHTFQQLDKWRPVDGDFSDGNPPVSGFFPYGCSPHYLDVRPGWLHGGLVAEAAYSNGVKFLQVSKQGQIEEVGWFLGYGGSALSATWITDQIVYVIDPMRGLDIIRFTDDGQK